MPVTQLWVLAAVPSPLEDEIAPAYSTALTAATRYLRTHRRAFDDWCRDPSTFLCTQEAYDIQRHFKFLSPLNPRSCATYCSFFLRPEFKALYYQYGGSTAAGHYRLDERTIIKHIVTYGNTPADILYQAIGPQRAKQLPGFFGNLFIRHDSVPAERRRLSVLLDQADSGAMIQRAIEWTRGYNDTERVAEVLQALPQAFGEAETRASGLLGLQITVG